MTTLLLGWFEFRGQTTPLEMKFDAFSDAEREMEKLKARHEQQVVAEIGAEKLAAARAALDEAVDTDAKITAGSALYKLLDGFSYTISVTELDAPPADDAGAVPSSQSADTPHDPFWFNRMAADALNVKREEE